LVTCAIREKATSVPTILYGIHHGVHTTLDDCLDLVARRISGIEKFMVR
jgi:hypothetical protein